jgi:antitoxin VapB
MGLNIKNQRVHELAREAARVTGRSQTAAIEEALERLLLAYGSDPRLVRHRHKIERVHAIVAEYAADPGDTGRAIRRVEDLFDEGTGLPA